jgi:hypothetical protein
MDVALSQWTAVIVNEDTEQAIRNGRPVFLDNEAQDKLESYPPALNSSEHLCRAYTEDGCFLAVLRFNPEKKQWQPEKVFL